VKRENGSNLDQRPVGDPLLRAKARREEVLAQTPAAPWQLVRSFCGDRPHPDGWRNLLVWGENLLAMRELLADDGCKRRK
jgi:hypothetical protein